MSWCKRSISSSAVLSRSISLLGIASLLREMEDLALLYDRRVSLLGGEIVASVGSIFGLYGVFANYILQWAASSSRLSLFAFFSAFFSFFSLLRSSFCSSFVLIFGFLVFWKSFIFFRYYL